MQDILFEGSEFRINTPGTIDGNWIYKLNPNYKQSEYNKYLKELIKLKNR
jgi:4-alpha-glucanotransferase